MGFAAADGIVAISDSVQESLRSFLNVKDKKIRRIYNGTRIGVPADSCRKNRQQHSLRLIFVGRLIPEKGVQNTLRILAELKKEVPFVFSVVGEGPYRNDLELQSETLGLKEQVRFLGRRDDISELLAESDVFIHLPEWEEGFGITVIEALAEGCICLINNRGALPEIVEHEKSGYIVPAASTEAVVAMLRRLWEMPDEEWNRMSTNARQRVQLFSMKRFAENLDGFLSEVFRS
jgi:glycosyltransferase involved in cell wall biosynthesis